MSLTVVPSTKTITVGMPVWKGQPHIVAALDCLQRQTFEDFEVIISVDGNDNETADACRPFLTDARFRMVVQPERLDWFGNFNWLLQQPIGQFFCYRQHDDTTSPDFFATLLRTAQQHPGASAVYADCQWQGTRSDLEATDSIIGATPLSRVLTYIERLDAPPVRGLIRRAAIEQAGLVRSDEFRGLTQILTWLAKVVRWGDFIRVALPIYYRLDHETNFHKSWHDWPEDKKRTAWATTFTGLLEAAVPLCSSSEEISYVAHMALDRVLVGRPTRTTLYVPSDPASAAFYRSECYERLRYEIANGMCDPALQDVLTHAGSSDTALGRRTQQRIAELEQRLSILEKSRALRLARKVRSMLGRPH